MILGDARPGLHAARPDAPVAALAGAPRGCETPRRNCSETIAPDFDQGRRRRRFGGFCSLAVLRFRHQRINLQWPYARNTN